MLLLRTPLSLGIVDAGWRDVEDHHARNSTIPATGSEMFTTGRGQPDAVDIHVVSGLAEPLRGR